MNILYINNKNCGVIAHYMQNRECKEWQFSLENGITICIPFEKIRSFYSCCKVDNAIQITLL